MPTIDELFRARDEFERTIQNQYNLLDLAKQHLSTEQCPSRQELAPVLRSIQEMSRSLASFLEVLNGVLNGPDSRARLELLNFQEVMPSSERARNLMEPRYLLIPLVNAFYRNQTPTSLLWGQTFDLAIWYSEYTNTISGFYYIIENHIKGYHPDNKWLWGWMNDFCNQYRIMALHSMAKRAEFLEISSDSEIKAGEAVWWCEQIDAFPKTSSYYQIFIGFLNRCPDAKNPIIIERLKEFARLENSSDNEFDKGQQETIRNQAISLLNP